MIDIIHEPMIKKLTRDIECDFDVLSKTYYQQGLNDAWEAARQIILFTQDGGLGSVDLELIFGETGCVRIIKSTSASEAIAKIKEYKEKQKDATGTNAGNIQVGDEVEMDQYGIYPNYKGVVIADYGTTAYPYHVMFSNGDAEWVSEESIGRKTGRRLDQITEVAKWLQEDR